ncbi:MAG TPA: cysteine desulfurase [Clostridiales bacterium]|nr:cysteine desulfurase [Clostridiales bacterium]
MKMIYLDNAATTPLDKDVFEAMKPYFCEHYGNPESQHSLGKKAEFAVIRAREQVARALGASDNEIYFTCSATEANNWAFRGVVSLCKKPKKRIITSAIEHSSIISCVEDLVEQGVEVIQIKPDNFGVISPQSVIEALDPNTILVSIMLANNEIGTIQPIKEICQAVKKYNKDILFHTDAVQAIGALDVNARDLGADMLSISAHKFYGPKGVGALYIKNGVKIQRLIAGGNQERGQRGGTSNVPAIVGLGAAIKKAVQDRQKNSKHIRALRDYFIQKIEENISYAKLNGHRTQRLDGNVNFSFDYVKSQSVLNMLDIKGIAASAGSACTAGNFKPSYVLMAMGVPEELASSSIRFSIGKYNTIEEIDYAIEALTETIAELRKLSPLFVDIKTKKYFA